MRWKTLSLRSRAHVVSLGILAAGLLAGLLIHALTPPDAADPLGDPSGSKRYVPDLEVYGGKPNVLRGEFRRWFDGLWHGRQLAVTVAFLAVAVFLAIQLVLSQAAPAPGPKRLHLVPPGRPPDAE